MHNRVDHLQQKNSQIINYVHTPLLLVAMFVQMGGGGGTHDLTHVQQRLSVTSSSKMQVH